MALAHCICHRFISKFWTDFSPFKHEKSWLHIPSIMGFQIQSCLYCEGENWAVALDRRKSAASVEALPSLATASLHHIKQTSCGNYLRSAEEGLRPVVPALLSQIAVINVSPGMKTRTFLSLSREHNTKLIIPIQYYKPALPASTEAMDWTFATQMGGWSSPPIWSLRFSN